jgi:hypothetical protein
MRYLLFIIAFYLPLSIFAQKLPEIDALNRVILNHKDSIIYAHLLPAEDGRKIHISDNYWYCWYAQHDIKETRGGFDGKVLHGEYTEFYGTKELKKKGYFKNGMKTGKWKSWYINGQLFEIAYYKHGLRNGKFYRYNELGTLVTEGKYRKGVLVVKKEKQKKEKKSKQAENSDRGKKSNRAKKKLKGEKETSSDPTTKPQEEIQKNKKKKKGKEPNIRIRRSIKIVPQPGKST